MVEVPPPNFIGPTWKRGPDGKFVLPERSLGWEVAGWCYEYLLDPNSTEAEPKPWLFTNEQLRFLLHWYALDENGRFPYRIGVLQRLKGWGKDPLLAAISLVELVGPSRFERWDEDGSPVGCPHPAAWVRVVATSQAQTTNTFEMFPRLMSSRLIEEYNVEPGAELIRARGGKARLMAITSNPRSAEGGRATFTLANETQHWVAGNQGIRMFETIRFDAAKGGNRVLSITNAYLPGEDSAAERQRRAYTDVVEGRAVDAGLMYDSIEADPSTPLTPEAIRQVIPLIRGDSVWLDPENLMSEILSTDVSPARSRRMWYNQVLADDDALYQEQDWDQSGVEGALEVGDEVVLGFDGGRSDDATALVAVRVSDGFAQPLLVEERPDAELRLLDEDSGRRWEVDRDAVDAKVHWAMREYKVVGMYADVALWESYLAQWGAEYGHKMRVKGPDGRNPLLWDMRGATRRATMAHELLLQSIRDGRVPHGLDGRLNLTLRRHVLNARRHENVYGVSFRKESRDSAKKVDAYAALMLAWQCRADFMQAASGKKARTGRGWFF